MREQPFSLSLVPQTAKTCSQHQERSEDLLCLPRTLPKVYVSPALRQKFSFVKWGNAHRRFQNSHVFLVPHLVSLSTRSCAVILVTVQLEQLSYHLLYWRLLLLSFQRSVSLARPVQSVGGGVRGKPSQGG